MEMVTAVPAAMSTVQVKVVPDCWLKLLSVLLMLPPSVTRGKYGAVPPDQEIC